MNKRKRKQIETLSGLLLDVLFPATCPVCREVLIPGQIIHGECKEKLDCICEPCCMICGLPLEINGEELCRSCRNRRPAYDWNRSCFVYEGAVRSAMLDLKYENRKEFARFFGRELYEQNQELLAWYQPAVILPVPLFAAKKRKRGYNQAELLALEVSKESGIFMDPSLVIRRKDTEALSRRNYSERKEEVLSAFALTKAKVPERVLLVDDICTTGSTLNELAALLKRNGARQVGALTCCREV